MDRPVPLDGPASGRIHECDLLITTPGGLYLLELRAHPGRVVNRDDTWRFTEPGTGRVRTLRNPLPFTDVKSKDLKSRLEWAADGLKIDRRSTTGRSRPARSTCVRARTGRTRASGDRLAGRGA